MVFNAAVESQLKRRGTLLEAAAETEMRLGVN